MFTRLIIIEQVEIVLSQRYLKEFYLSLLFSASCSINNVYLIIKISLI